MKITDIQTHLLTGPCTLDPYLSQARRVRSGAFVEIYTDIGQPDASFTGGLSEFMAVSRMLAERGRQVATHAWGAGGSLMQNIHCGFAAENTIILEVAPAYGPLHSEIVGNSFVLHDGQVLPPTKPGLGIELTEATKRRFPFVPGSGKFNSVPGKILPEEQDARRHA
jgi:L-alanine-DL-glutamate epimerase-like enolase superfamily enzyme